MLEGNIAMQVRHAKFGKRLVAIAVVSILLFMGVVWGSFFFFVPNIGLPFGYYGKFNLVRRQLRQIPGIRILGSHQHKDVSLEDFWFTLQTDSGLILTVKFDYVDKTYELFKSADGLCVRQAGSADYLLYRLEPGNPLDAATARQIGNALDILQNFDKIAHVITADQDKKLAGAQWEDVPKGYLWVIYPVGEWERKL
jgi:hypothetical protein